MLKIKAASECRYDVLSLGDVMLRLDPGEGRIRTARQFRVWEGGGEYNVARGLRRCFSQRAAVVTGIVKNETGLLLEDLIMQGGVDTSFVKWFDYDGIGLAVRNSLNFTERGFGVRGAVGCSDRGHSATSKIKPGDIDWDYIFGECGVRWFHTGGIYAALSDESYQVIGEAMATARKYGTVVSYDLNYRESLWKSRGGLAQCQQVNRELAALADVMIGFPVFLGLEPEDKVATDLDTDAFEKLIGEAAELFPNLKVFASTLRHVSSASSVDWSATCWAEGGFHRSDCIRDLNILDRVGGGDSFAAGLIYGFLAGKGAAAAVNYGIAHGALAMTTPGDNSMASLSEVEKVMSGCRGRTQR
ncbi:sugar kinase [Granulosicoccaceae sp. 1_MG-2023]|nr:sugar kinase [Granulosicoccaceae sp. 1_MG-2023]